MSDQDDIRRILEAMVAAEEIHFNESVDRVGQIF